MLYKTKKGYKLYTICRFCGSGKLEKVIDLKKMPLAGGFLRSKIEFTKEQFYPLTLGFCNRCSLLQTREVITADTLFKDYYYHSSAIQTLVNHFEDVASMFSKNIKNPTKKLVVEIGCNDGVFIQRMLKRGYRAVGVDPASNIVDPLIKKGLPLINDYFTSKTVNNIISKYGYADIIFSSNTLAHIEDMNEVFQGIVKLLKKNGQLVFEVHYLGKVINSMQFDMIYHEHQYYYSLIAIQKFLSKFSLEVFDIKLIPIHGGSLRIFAQKKDAKRKIKSIVYETVKKEKDEGLTKTQTFINYNQKIKNIKKELLGLLKQLKNKDLTLAGYGASGRGTTVMNYIGLTNEYLDYVIDDAPAKQRAFTPGIHLPIVASDILHTKNRPDYVLLFAWSFQEEIMKRNAQYYKNGGKFIIPIPSVKII